MPTKNLKYAIATPYIIPPILSSKKVVNVGDGFILNGVIRMVGTEPDLIISCRVQPTPEQITKINQLDFLVLAGANQLNDKFSVFPKYTVQDLKKITVPIIPMAIGIHGIPSENKEMSSNTKEIMLEIHSRIKASSWRCPLTTEYINKNLPEISEKVMMTGCPVAYDQAVLNENVKFPLAANKIAVTITDRGDFMESEGRIVEMVRERFPNSELYLCLHQDNLPKVKSWLSTTPLSGLLNSRDPFVKIRNVAKSLGYKIVPFHSAAQTIEFYKKCDLHIGSRLHAHLYFLSNAKPSFLFGFDYRHKGIAQTFGIQIRESNDFELRKEEFEGVGRRIQQGYKVMQKFKELNGI
jgi:hypothetical protein